MLGEQDVETKVYDVNLMFGDVVDAIENLLFFWIVSELTKTHRYA